ncbi:hypothetical protein ACFLTE_01770 [Bacteroidota bacterium]
MLKEYRNTRKRLKAIKYLKNIKSKKLIKLSEKSVIKAFKRASKRTVAYKEILISKNIEIAKIKNLRNFQENVPIIDKEQIFPNNNIDKLCLNGSITSIKSIFSSSGFSGIYSFGVNTKKNYKNISKSIDTSLEYLFQISKKKTFLISCIPMGVKVHTSLPIAETSIRSDMALSIIKKFSGYYDQIIIVGDPYFIKKIAEEGIEQQIDWSKINSSFIFGEDWFSQSFREYIENLTGMKPELNQERKVLATLGIAELDLNLFHESKYTIEIRREAQKNIALRQDLFGEGNSAPILFHYFPHRTYMECINGELIFSMLSPNLLIPLIRYNSKDSGKLYSYKHIETILKKHNLNHYIPDIKLPFVSVYGRKENYIIYKNEKIIPEDIKQSIFENLEVARLTTGYFRLSNDEVNPIEIQLNKGIVDDKKIRQLFENQINKYLPVSLPVKLYTYESFPYAMELDYEKKFKFI